MNNRQCQLNHMLRLDDNLFSLKIKTKNNIDGRQVVLPDWRGAAQTPRRTQTSPRRKRVPACAPGRSSRPIRGAHVSPEQRPDARVLPRRRRRRRVADLRRWDRPCSPEPTRVLAPHLWAQKKRRRQKENLSQGMHTQLTHTRNPDSSITTSVWLCPQTVCA